MDGYRVAERGDTRLGKGYSCNWLQGAENTTDTTHMTYLHGIYKECPIFKAVEGEYGVKIYIVSPRIEAQHRASAPALHGASQYQPQVARTLGREERRTLSSRSSRRSGFCPSMIPTARRCASPSIPKRPSRKVITAAMSKKPSSASANPTTADSTARSAAMFRWKTKPWWKARDRSSTGPSNIRLRRPRHPAPAQDAARRHCGSRQWQAAKGRVGERSTPCIDLEIGLREYDIDEAAGSDPRPDSGTRFELNGSRP